MFLLFNSDIGYRNRHCWRNGLRMSIFICFEKLENPMDKSIPNDLTSSATFRVISPFRKRSGCWRVSFIEYDLCACWPYMISVSGL